ncbi:MAG: hybrid sensor histidine kinase/response regulator [Bacteroidota bacterium]
MEGTKLLCFEDDPGIARLLQKRLVRAGFEIAIARRAQKGLDLIKEGQFDLVILDYWLPDMNGLEVLERIQQLDPNLPVVIVTASSEAKVAVEAIKRGALDYLAKDSAGVFIRKIEHHLQDWLEIHREKMDQVELITDLKNYAQTVAHDLKNPLSTLKALTGLLSFDENNEKEIAKYASAIATTVDKMRGIVDELLLMASTRKEDIQLTKLNTEMLISNALDRLDYLIQDRGASIEIDKKFPDAIGYPAWVEEIWVNYLSNALKYAGPKPEIIISGETLKDGTVRFWVKDNGPGIPEEKLSALFVPLSKLDYDNTDGHGLGLSIVKRIAQKLNGEVGAQSQAGEGASFYFTLPRSNTIPLHEEEPPSSRPFFSQAV